MDNYKEKVKEKVREELNTDYAKENIQILVTVGQILGGIMVTIAFLTFDATLEDNYWIAAGALFLTILLPSSSKLKTLCSSEFLRQFGFYIFTGSVGITIAFLSVLISGISESLSKLPIGIWIYLASGLLLFYEYNRVEKSELKKSFRFVATGLFILSVGSEIIIISHIWNLATSLVQFILVVPSMFVLSLWFSYALITSAIEVDEIKKNENIDRESVMEDNLIVWRNFPLRIIKTFPDFIKYFKEICINRDLTSIKST